jgi:hypothetical protein
MIDQAKPRKFTQWNVAEQVQHIMMTMGSSLSDTPHPWSPARSKARGWPLLGSLPERLQAIESVELSIEALQDANVAGHAVNAVDAKPLPRCVMLNQCPPLPPRQLRLNNLPLAKKLLFCRTGPNIIL